MKPTSRFGFLGDVAVVAVLLIGLWWLVVLLVAPQPFLLPGPDRVALMLVTRWRDLGFNALVTAYEILIGLGCGIALGITTALTMSVAPVTARLIQPIVVVLQTLPVFAIAPLLVLWLGFGLASKIVLATTIIFFPVASAFHDGLARTAPGLLDLARLYRASRVQTIRLIRVPFALPALISGLRMAVTIAPIGAISGEWVGGEAKGLGAVMLQASARLQTDLMFAALVVVIAIAVVLRLGADALTRRLAPWAPELN